MDLEKAIDELLTFEATVKDWGSVHNSTEFIAASRLAKGLNHSLNSGCSNCLNDLFILAKIYKRDKNKLNQKQKIMNSKYELYPNKVLSFPKLGIHITNANLTDEIARDYLNIYPAARVHFKVIPESHFYTKVVVRNEEKPKLETPKIEVKTTETLRELVDRIAETKGVKKPHWKASDYTLNKFLAENK